MADGVDTSIYKDAIAENPLDMAGKVVEYKNKLLGNVQHQQAVEKNAIGIDSAKVDLAMKRFGIMNDAISGLIGDRGYGTENLKPKINGVMGRLVKDGVLSAQHAVEALQGIPDDPREQANALRNFHTMTQTAMERGNSFFGQPQTQNVGNALVTTQTPQYPGKPIATRGNVPLALPPTTETVQDDPTKPGYGKKVLLGQTPAPAVRQGPGVVPAAPQAPARVNAPPPADTPITTALPPGQAEAASVAGGASGGALGDARNRSLNFQQEVTPLEQAIPALEKLGTKGTGPGTESINSLKSFILSNVPGADFKGLKDDVATYDKAKKYLTDFVNQNGNSGTNDKLAAAFAGNPSVNISNAAAVDVAKTALTLRRFKQAQLLAFEGSGKPDADFAKEAGKFAREHDPRAYGFDMMSPAERKKVIESLPKGKRELFMMDVQDAVSQGVLKAPQAK